MGLDQYVYLVHGNQITTKVDFDDVEGAEDFWYWGRDYRGI